MSVELTTGRLRDPDPLDYITKETAVAPAPPGTLAMLWLAFLERITAGDKELQSYLQRVAGYCLTGDVSEHVLFFLYGTGANGKSVFINTLVEIWGEVLRLLGIRGGVTPTTPTAWPRSSAPDGIARSR